MNRFDDNPASEASRGTRGSSAKLPGFGFDLPDDDWLNRIRSAERHASLGHIGPYELVEEISRGAQGIVYRARQPNTNRQIALKRLLAGSFATPETRTRFEREVRIASDLNHPNIVTVYGSEIVEGQPNLAMEWIDGQRVDRWAREGPGGKRSVAEVLGLLATICDAVHHAHQRGVIHRDLKPSNILVDAVDHPHILDFGMAKLLSPDQADTVVLTRTRDFLGTPAYASPEQVRGRHADIDVRSDLYALGVILFQMLTGRLPYPDERNLAELLQAIKETDAPRPSELDARLDREIDAIVLKALAKEPDRRYASVDGLGTDVRRYLAGEPVLAHPPTAVYHLRKLIARHRAPFLLASVSALIITGLAATSTVLSFRLNEQRKAAVAAEVSEAKARRVADQVNVFLRDLLAAAEPDRAHGQDVLVRDVVDKAAQEIEQRTDLPPEVAAAVRGTIGATYYGLGMLDSAEQQLLVAVELARGVYGDLHAEVARHLNALANVYHAQGRLADAGALYEEAYRIRTEVLNPGHEDIATSLANIAGLALERNDLETAQPRLEQAIQMFTALYGVHHRSTVGARLDMATLYRRRGQAAEAAACLRELLPTVRESFGPAHTRTFQALNNLAVILKELHEYDEAQSDYEELIESARRVYGPDHPNTINFEGNLASLYQARGDLDEAETRLQAVHDRAVEILGESNPTTLAITNNLAGLRLSRGETAEAVALFRRSVAGHREIFGDAHPATAIAMGGLGRALLTAKSDEASLAESESLLLKALSVFEATLPDDHPFRRKTLETLSELYGPEALNDPEALRRITAQLES